MPCSFPALLLTILIVLYIVIIVAIGNALSANEKKTNKMRRINRRFAQAWGLMRRILNAAYT